MNEMKKTAITLNVNNETFDIVTFPNQTLLEVLRDHLRLTGTKESCGEGVCGSCTVLINGTPIRSCLTLAVAVQGKVITTIEGLRVGEKLHPVQEAFILHGGIQCGFCSPGMILYPKAALFGFCVALVIFNAISLLKAALRGCHGAQKIEEQVSNYYIAAELETTARGMMIAIPPEHWRVFAVMTPAVFVKAMLMLAGKVNLRHFQKHPRGTKKPQPERTYDPAHPHVSTAKILAQRSRRKNRAT